MEQRLWALAFIPALPKTLSDFFLCEMGRDGTSSKDLIFKGDKVLILCERVREASCPKVYNYLLS